MFFNCSELKFNANAFSILLKLMSNILLKITRQKLIFIFFPPEEYKQHLALSV